MGSGIHRDNPNEPVARSVSIEIRTGSPLNVVETLSRMILACLAAQEPHPT
jgi:hypothetical protein